LNGEVRGSRKEATACRARATEAEAARDTAVTAHAFCQSHESEAVQALNERASDVQRHLSGKVAAAEVSLSAAESQLHDAQLSATESSSNSKRLQERYDGSRAEVSKLTAAGKVLKATNETLLRQKERLETQVRESVKIADEKTATALSVVSSLQVQIHALKAKKQASLMQAQSSLLTPQTSLLSHQSSLLSESPLLVSETAASLSQSTFAANDHAPEAGTGGADSLV
jgi:chromosome segregation ATPase